MNIPIPYEYIIKHTFSNPKEKKRFISYYRHTLSILLFALFLVVTVIVYLYNFGLPSGGASLYSDLISIANSGLLLLLLILGLPTEKNHNLLKDLDKTQADLLFGINSGNRARRTNITRAYKSVIAFNNYWRITVAILLVFYMYKTLLFFIGIWDWPIEKYSNTLVVEYILDIVNVASSLSFFVLFLVLAIPTFDKSHKRSKIPSILYAVICIAVILLGFDYYMEFDNTNFKAKIILCVLYGLFSSIIMALFAGRLDSKFMSVSGIWILLLYTYSFVLLLLPILNFHIDESRDQLMALSKNPIIDDFLSYYNHLNKSFVTYLFLFSFIIKFLLSLLLIHLFRSSLIVLYFIRMNTIRPAMKDLDKKLILYNNKREQVPPIRGLFTDK